jgi:dethiobiotin synthetase
MTTILITGTDTDTGKTIITASLRAYYQQYFPHFQVGLMKLLQTGREENLAAPLSKVTSTSLSDRQFYQQFFADVVIPLSFSTPIAPPLAAKKENKYIDLGIIWQALSNLQSKKDLVLVEALGGLGSPVTEELTVADLAASWHLDSILVVPVKLGAIAQAVANVALARQCKINLKGIILNCLTPCPEEQINDWTPINLIQSLTQIPVLGIFPYLENMDKLETLAIAASKLNLNYL